MPYQRIFLTKHSLRFLLYSLKCIIEKRTNALLKLITSWAFLSFSSTIESKSCCLLPECISTWKIQSRSRHLILYFDYGTKEQHVLALERLWASCFSLGKLLLNYATSSYVSCCLFAYSSPHPGGSCNFLRN